jgi:hypothetical protein
LKETYLFSQLSIALKQNDDKVQTLIHELSEKGDGEGSLEGGSFSPFFPSKLTFWKNTFL